jgi:hypothetical protein
LTLLINRNYSVVFPSIPHIPRLNLTQNIAENVESRDSYTHRTLKFGFYFYNSKYVKQTFEVISQWSLQ